jgi:hypothetical protein
MLAGLMYVTVATITGADMPVCRTWKAKMGVPHRIHLPTLM